MYHLRDVVKTREAEGMAFRLRVPSLQISMGEKIALTGESGCGKSTMLDMLSFILRPSDIGAFCFRPAGVKKPLNVEAYWKANKLNRLSDLRKRHLGCVIQTGGLLPYLTVRDNMNLCRNVLGLKRDGTVEHLAAELGIANHLNKLPDALSTGERQRVAIGRALARKPAIVIADEPTASLDPYAAQRIMTHFMGLVDELNITVILATHAWGHVKKLGMRQLHHRTVCHAESNLTETLVSG